MNELYRRVVAGAADFVGDDKPCTQHYEYVRDKDAERDAKLGAEVRQRQEAEQKRDVFCDVCGQRVAAIPPPTADLLGEPWHLCLDCAKELEHELRVKRGHNEATRPARFMRQSRLMEA